MTQSKNQNARYARKLIEATLDPMITINPEGKIMDVNDAMMKATDMDRDSLIGTDFITYFQEKENAFNIYKEIFISGFVLNYPLTIIDGVLTDVLLNGSVYKDNNNNILGAVVVARDITQLKRVEKELIESKMLAVESAKIAIEEKGKAELAMQAKQIFLSNMSHEIRTPLNAIIGFTTVLSKTELTDKQKEYLQAIKSSGDTLIVLINDILDLAKVNSGKMIFEQVPFEMLSTISTIFKLFETKIEDKKLKLKKIYDYNIPKILLGDFVRLNQIILNLLSNALKFTTIGYITVSVRLLFEDKEKVTIEFAISDTGIGINPQNLEIIFESYHQATNGTSRLYGGTGLGLAIVKQLVEMQGGTITVESTVNIGSKFIVNLTFQKTKEKIQKLESEYLHTDIKNLNILVVEDIPLNQLLMKTILEDFGFGTDIADNGKIAIEKLKNNKFDVILMDLQMPIMNGFETTMYIRDTMHSKIPIIALTADVTTADLAKCKSFGMNDYISKPLDDHLLYKKIIEQYKNPNYWNLSDNNETNIPLNDKMLFVDLSYLNNRTKSDPKLMLGMVAIYMAQTPLLIDAMKHCLENKDWNALQIAVQKMIPSMSIMGISKDFENLAIKIQEQTKNIQIQIADIPGLILQLEEVCTKSCNELEEEFNNLKKAFLLSYANIIKN